MCLDWHLNLMICIAIWADGSEFFWGCFRMVAQCSLTGLLSNQGEKSINFYFIRVPLRKKVLKYGTPKPS